MIGEEKMKESLEKLWNEYLLDECALMDTNEEKELTRKTAVLHRKTDEILNKEQKQAVQRYVDSLLDIESLFAKKAFIKGCEFAISFILESGNIIK